MYTAPLLQGLQIILVHAFNLDQQLQITGIPCVYKPGQCALGFINTVVSFVFTALHIFNTYVVTSL